MTSETTPTLDLSRQKRIPSGDAWTVPVAEYSMSDVPAFVMLRELVNQKRHTVKDSGATYRVINHWAEAGLIEDKNRDSTDGWRRLSLVDLAWIKVLVELRKYGVPLNLLRKARSAVFDVLDKPNSRLPDFEFAVANCLIKNPRRFLVVLFSDGWAELTDEGTLQLALESNLFSVDSYLIVDLNHCCKSLTPSAQLPDFRVRPSLSDEELAIVASIRSGEYDVIEVHGTDGKIDRIKCRKESNEVATRIEDLAKSIRFGEFTVKIQNGIPVVTEIIESKKV